VTAALLEGLAGIGDTGAGSRGAGFRRDGSLPA